MEAMPAALGTSCRRTIGPLFTTITAMLALAVPCWASASGSDEIPPVYEREQLAQSDKIFVKEFRIEGLDGTSDSARLRSAIAELAEEARTGKQGDTEFGAYGFSESEIEKILSFVSSSVRGTDPNANGSSYERLVRQLRSEGSWQATGMTVPQIQAVADDATGYMREQGYFLARAVVPAQDVSDGIVTIQVFEGRFGDVDVVGNQSYPASRIEKVFEDMKGEPITREKVEQRLYRMDDLAGLETTSTWEAGSEVGTSDLKVEVTEEDKYQFTGRLDNHITETSGTYRLMGSLAINNLSGTWGDRFTLNFSQSMSPRTDTFAGFNWSIPMGGSNSTFDFGYAIDDFELEQFAALGIGGRARIAHVGITTDLRRSRDRNLSSRLDFATKRGEITIEGLAPVTQDKLSVVGGQLDWDTTDLMSQRYSRGKLRLDVGIAGLWNSYSQRDAVISADNSSPPSRSGVLPGGGDLYADSNFVKLSWEMSRLQRPNGPDSPMEFRGRFFGQVTDDLLSSLETFSIGGPNSMRGLPVGSFQVDSAAAAQAELAYRFQDFNGTPAVFVFYDAVLGINTLPLDPSEKRRFFSGYGIGAEMNYPGVIARFQVGRLGSGDSHVAVFGDPDDMQYWIDLSRSF